MVGSLPERHLALIPPAQRTTIDIWKWTASLKAKIGISCNLVGLND